MRIIFVCKYNRFRSRVAEAYFKKYNKNKNIQVNSGGIFIGIPVAKSVISLGKKFNINPSGKPKGLREEELVKSDLIIIVANNVPVSLFKRFNKVIAWKIPDTSQNNLSEIERIMKQIFKKVDLLIKKLEHDK